LGKNEDFARLDVEDEGFGALGSAIDPETKHDEKISEAPPSLSYGLLSAIR
jgi:hypothetical protein